LPQHVVIGNPNFGLDSPDGGGAGVLCNFASFAANDGAEADDDEENRLVRFTKSVTRKCVEGESASLPCPYDCGHNVGTALWIALRDACSPDFLLSVILFIEMVEIVTFKHDRGFSF
jgi:hypothetical protein